MIVATRTAIYLMQRNGEDWAGQELLNANQISFAAEADNLRVTALDAGQIILRRDHASRRLDTGIDEPIESILILDPEKRDLLIGTEGAHLFRLTEGVVSRVESFDRLTCRKKWHTPWGGPAAVRSLAATNDGHVYADIHVGSIMHSTDRGENWQPVEPQLHEDVHQVAACRDAPQRVYANTADGVWISDDRGKSWSHRADDLDNRYGRAIAVCPSQPDLILATVSDGPHGDNVHGQLWRSEDAGQNWQHVSDGFPESTEQNINTYHVTFAPDESVWACVGRTVFLSTDHGLTWREVWRAPEPISMLACRINTAAP